MYALFPFAWTWTTRMIPTSGSLSAGRAIDALAEGLRREGAKIVVSQAEEVEFECSGISGMSRMALLAPISGGSISVQIRGAQIETAYRLRFVIAFWFSLAVGTVFALTALRNDPLATGALAFAWLYFGNVAISLFRFSRFVQRVLASSPPPNKSLERTREG